MPSYNGPRSHAQDAREALRRLAHETRTLEDPTDIYPVLGDLSNALVSLAQTLHQIGDFHGGPACERAWVADDARAGRAASYQVAWDVHRAAEMVLQVAAGIDRAHEVEATIAYDVRGYPTLASRRFTREPGLSL